MLITYNLMSNNMCSAEDIGNESRTFLSSTDRVA